jgi:hypothetical protein
MHLEVLRIEPTQTSDHVPAVEDSIDVIAFTLTGDLGKSKPQPAVERIDLAKTDVHGSNGLFASWIKL